MTTKRHRSKVSFSKEELEQVNLLCKKLHLSLSELLRRLVLGYRLPDANNFEIAKCIRDLLIVNADQARLGNLLRLTLDSSSNPLIEPLVTDIRESQNYIKKIVCDLRGHIS
jgi:hypothetical protein